MYLFMEGWSQLSILFAYQASWNIYSVALCMWVVRAFTVYSEWPSMFLMHVRMFVLITTFNPNCFASICSHTFILYQFQLWCLSQYIQSYNPSLEACGPLISADLLFPALYATVTTQSNWQLERGEGEHAICGMPTYLLEVYGLMLETIDYSPPPLKWTAMS